MLTANHRSPILLWLLLTGLVILTPTLFAQQQDAKKAAENKEMVANEGESSKKSEDNMFSVMFQSNWMNIAFMSVLGVFSLFAFTIIIERLVNLTYGRLVPAGFAEQFRQLTGKTESNPEPFRELCKQHEAPVSRILKAGLARSGRSLMEVEKAMEDAAARENAAIRSRIRPLTVIANVAPLVGLLGTVVGMIVAFRELSISEGGADKPKQLAQGIYLALTTTVAGLAISIPTQLFAAWFQSRTDKYMRSIDEALLEAIPCFTRMEKLENSAQSEVGESEKALEPVGQG